MAKSNIWGELEQKELERALYNGIYTELLSIKYIRLSAKDIQRVAKKTVEEFTKNTSKK